jgi:hypothetical protein
MMDKDPNNRPTLEGVLMSFYHNDARDSYGDPEERPTPQSPAPKSDLAVLRKAMAAYTKKVGREVSDVVAEMNGLHADLVRADIRAKKYPDQMPEFEQLQAALPAALAELQKQLEAINERPDVAPLVKAIKQAGESFGTAKGREKDNAWDFAYRKVQHAMDNIDKDAPTMPEDLKEEIETPTGT